MTVAQTILEQIGGRRFLVMTGAKDLLGFENGLQFKLPKFPGISINSVRITLDPSDTYTIEFGKVGRADYRVIETVSDVYCDMLADVFESVTGLATSL